MQYRVTSGRVVEICTYYEYDGVKKRGGRKKESPLSKAEHNVRGAIKRLARQINCNFKKGDWLLTLNYDEAHLPADAEDARRILRNFMRRLCRAYKKANGREPRYITVTSDKDPGTGEIVRLHHHIVMEAFDLSVVEGLWRDGNADVEYLKKQADYTPLAVYLVRQAQADRDRSKYSPSRNLIAPAIKKEKVTRAGRYRVPRGAVICERHYDEDELGVHEYVRYIMPDGEAEEAYHEKL